MADYAVQPGDVFFLPAGRIHSIGAGCFIAEIQQTSNVTYRIYDFNRKDKNGNTRELHTELSKDAIDYSVEEDYRTHYTPKQNESVELVTCPYFTTSVVAGKRIDSPACNSNELPSPSVTVHVPSMQI